MATESKQIGKKQELTALEKAFSHTFNKDKMAMAQIRHKAENAPDCVFNSLAHLLTPELLTESFKQLNKRAAVGIDGISCEDYQANLDNNITKLHESLKNRSYEPKCLKRVWIDKGNGKNLAKRYHEHLIK